MLFLVGEGHAPCCLSTAPLGADRKGNAMKQANAPKPRRQEEIRDEPLLEEDEITSAQDEEEMDEDDEDDEDDDDDE